MQTTTTRPPRARETPTYPSHQHHNSPAFFLGCLLREQAQQEAIRHLAIKEVFRKNRALADAAFHCVCRLDEAIKKSIKYVVEDGLLPFAHARTTYFDQQVPA